MCCSFFSEYPTLSALMIVESICLFGLFRTLLLLGCMYLWIHRKSLLNLKITLTLSLEQIHPEDSVLSNGTQTDHEEDSKPETKEETIKEDKEKEVNVCGTILESGSSKDVETVSVI